MSTLEAINRSIWELQERIREHPDEPGLRKNLLKFFFESQLFIEEREGVPAEKRSFLLLQEREALCCFLIHGAGGTPEEMKPLGQHLFRQGYTVYCMKLPFDPKETDSGMSGYLREKLGIRSRNEKSRKRLNPRGSWSLCLSHSEIVLDTLLSYTSSIYLIGFSFGGTIALNLLRKYPVKGTVLISPGLYPSRGRGFLIFNVCRKLFPNFVRDMAPIKNTLMELIEKTRSDFSPLEDPVLVIQAMDDPVMSRKGFHFLKRNSVNPLSRFVILESGGHVLIDGDQRDRVFQMCSDFIKGF